MTTIDLTTSGSSTTIATTSSDQAILSYLSDADAIVSGTGAYDPFLTSDGSGGGKSDGVTEAFNWDVGNSPVLDEVTGHSRTNSLDLSTLKVVTVGGTTYYEFRLDLNESPDPVQLNDLKVYLSATAANPADFNNTTDAFNSNYSLILDLNSTVQLIDHEPGSGRDDYKLLIPTSAFGDDPSGFVTFYANYGAEPIAKNEPSPTAEDGGFDEWAALLNDDNGGGGGNPPPASLSIEKVTADLGDNSIVDGTPGDAITVFAGENIRWQYLVTNTGEAAFDSVSITDDKEGLITEHTVVFGDDDDLFEAGEKWLFTATGVATTGPYENSATATGHVVASDVDASVESEADTSSYTGIVAHLTIDKTTQDMGGEGDADDGVAADGNNIFAGEAIQWVYKVTNDGTVDLHNVVVVDDQGTEDTSDDVTLDTITTLAAGQSITRTLAGVAKAGNYSNTATARADAVTDSALHSVTASDSDDSSYFGITTGIDVEKLVSLDGGATWLDADTVANEPTLLTGFDPKFRFVVTNLSNVALADVVLSDDKLDLNGSADGGSFTIASLAAADNVVGGGSDTYVLDVGGTWQIGQHTNTATVSASYSDTAGHVANFSDTDKANYFGAAPSISIDKQTNGVDHGLNLFAGQAVTWSFTVKNTGNVELSNVTLADDKVLSVTFTGGDTDNDGKLDLNETWTYTASGVAQQMVHVNTATVTGQYTDSAHHTKTVSNTDTSDYDGYGRNARTQGFWNNVSDAWDGYTTTALSNSTKSKVGTDLSSVEINKNKGFIILGDTNNDGFANEANSVKISTTLAKSILASSTTGDARIIMLQQAIAAQLNIMNGAAAPTGLIDDAMKWLTATGQWTNVSTNAFTGATKSGDIVTALSKTAVSTSGSAWKTAVDEHDGAAISKSTGEGLKNALMWYNQGQLVVTGNTDGDHVAWYNGTSFVAEENNSSDSFWLTLHTVGGLTGIV